MVPQEHEYSRSFEYSSPPMEQLSSSNYTTNDKQSRSFDAVHLLRPGTNRHDVVNRRTKSYEYAADRSPSSSSIAPAPIIIKIPDMSELVQAAQLSRLKNRRDSTEMVKSKLVFRIFLIQKKCVFIDFRKIIKRVPLVKPLLFSK